jgi:hypothetical protein
VRNHLYRSDDGKTKVHAEYRSVLDAWPEPHEELRIPTCQGETFIVTCGSAGAPAVLLLHGGATNSAMWIRSVQTWARTFRLHAVDTIGAPGFSAPSRPPLSSDAYARWLDDVLAVSDCLASLSSVHPLEVFSRSITQFDDLQTSAGWSCWLQPELRTCVSGICFRLFPCTSWEPGVGARRLRSSWDFLRKRGRRQRSAFSSLVS